MPVCPVCHRTTATRHTRCRNILDQRIANLPALYTLLAAVLEPGTAPGTRVSGTRTPPLPVRLEPLNLRGPGGIITTLADWEDDWAGRRNFTHHHRGNTEHDLAQIVIFLRHNLDWALDHHPAVADFADEIRDITTTCNSALGLRTNHKRIGNCPTVGEDGHTCGRTLYADPYLDTIHCDRCHSEWPRNRWLILGAAMAQNAQTPEYAA